MKVTKEFSINGKVVQKTETRDTILINGCELQVFRGESNKVNRDENTAFYFVMDESVIFSMHISTGMGQGSGFINEVLITSID